ncbi:unnamed protein product [Clavelina lepadiformis]|uniref:N-acetyltransferase domain-containing protein n=1 Tax=Clavelina lepadiformis TaxID=159417 RepID=A0ABP0FIW5_CLALP
MPIETSGIYYRLLTVNDKKDVIESVANHFCMMDPLCISLKFSEKERYEYATYAAMFLADNTSIGAFDGDQLCGVQINCSSHYASVVNVEKYLQSVSPKTKYFIRFDDFLQKVMDKFCGKNYIAGYWVSVDEAYSGRGVAQQLVVRSIKRNTISGQFDSIVGIATAPESKHIAEKYGFNLVHKMKMSDYEDESTGERIFADASIASMHFVFKPLTPKANL